MIKFNGTHSKAKEDSDCSNGDTTKYANLKAVTRIHYNTNTAIRFQHKLEYNIIQRIVILQGQIGGGGNTGHIPLTDIWHTVV